MIAVGVTLRRGGRGRGSDDVEIVREEFRLAKGRRVVAPKTVVLEFREGERILFSDPVVNTRVS
jgi:hypothetical protein